MMNPVTSALRFTPVYTPPAPLQIASVRQAASAVADAPATQVTLGQDTRVANAETYSSKGTLGTPVVRLVWENEGAQDKLSTQMFTSAASTNIGARFQGLGASLIEQLAANGGQRVSQSALAVGVNGSTEPGILDLQRANLREHASNSVTLSLTTASGATVNIGLYSGEQGLAVEASVSNGELNDDELKALAAMADGFQKAVDGLNQEKPSLQLGDLLKVDQSLFSGLQMSAKLELASGEQQTFDLRLNGSTRSLSLQGPSGQVQLELDSKGGALLGGKAQREAAIGNYLTQFDAARQRGKGDEQLATLFKDAFSQLNSVDDDSARPARHSSAMSTLSRSLLSGVADFTASISETVKASNPMRPEEIDRFDYSVSQSTSKDGKGNSFSLQQEQQSSLKASWHSSLNPLVGLQLSRDNASQNYRYHQVNDEASSSTRASVVNGALTEASSTQQASRSERVRVYQEGVLKSDNTTSASERKSRDQLALITTLLDNDAKSRRQSGISTFEQQMADKSSAWLLQSDPSRI